MIIARINFNYTFYDFHNPYKKNFKRDSYTLLCTIITRAIHPF